MMDVYLGIAVFVSIVLLLAVSVLIARAVLMPSKPVTITLNQDKRIAAKTGAKLLSALGDAGISIPSACGSAGTCGQCRVQIVDGPPAAAQTETAILSRRDIAQGIRLACQTTLRDNISIVLPDTVLAAQTWDCRVRSSRTIAPLIREIVLDLPADGSFTFTPGEFVMVTAPAYALRYADFDIAAEHKTAWEDMALNGVTSSSATEETRAYSIATHANDKGGQITLLIRLALPPQDQADIPPGIVSSWLFGRQESDTVTVAGPFGTFAAQDSQKEMVFIGGGVGMAPLRAIISDQLETKKTTRKISFWFGARSEIDLFYEDEFIRLEKAHPNFNWTAALSDPAPEDNWQGETGFIHEVALRCGLSAHPAPHNCEYYLCGPPLMIKAVLAMLDDLGVDPDQIYNDDFGA
jgi:Na+-transporting NADH:ubiquinone oxidoreductase subunit F